MRRTLAGTAALFALHTAEDARADGLYGRFDGDLTLRAHAGLALAAEGPALAAHASALYLATAGVYLHYTDILESSSAETTRSFATGLHVAPLFLARYASDAEHGPPHFDLLLDSIAFQIGTCWIQPRGSPWIAEPGLELAIDLSLPVLGRATGPFVGVRGALRWQHADFTAGTGNRDLLNHGALISLTLGWHHVLQAHLVDPGDGSLR